jgi:starch synthase
VIVSQPVHQHAYETAVAAQEAGFLHCFLTGLYYTGGGLTDPSIRRWLPSAVGRPLERELRRRWHPELQAALVTTIPGCHILTTAVRRATGNLPWLRDLDLDTWAHRRFDAAVGRRLTRLGPLAAVHAFEGAALATFRNAKRIGVRTILDVPSAHERFTAVDSKEGHQQVDRRISAERRLADYLFAPSDFVVECLTESGVEPDRILKIPYAADPAQFRPAIKHSAREGFTALFVGRVGLHKGVPYLLEAWRRLALPNAELVLVGPANQTGRELLRRYSGVARWVGAVPKYRVHHWFQASDVFVFPSLAEGSALVTYEAMAAGLPLVTTPNSGSVIRDDVDGFLIPPRNVDALCDRIRLLYEHPDIGQGMGERARQLIQERYTWTHYRQRVATAYHSILEDLPMHSFASGEG